MVDPLPWQTQETKTVYRNRWIGVTVDKVALPDGRSYEYTRLEPAGIGVAVIGFNERGEVLLEREYRHGVGQTIWQLPGGLAAAGEDYQVAGLRELLEETGFAPRAVNAETVRYLGMVWDNPGFGIAQSQLYAAWGLAEVAASRRDPEEFVTVHWKSQSWLREAVRRGEIQDRVVVSALSLLLLNGWME